jgi:UPF0755 protein
MKKLFLVIPALILCAGLLFFWWKGVVEPVSGDTQTQDFLISKGASASTIANNLYEKGFIKNALAFRLFTQLTGSSKKIIAGEYTLSPNYSLYKTVDILLKGPTEVWVTIPEGLRKEQIAVKFAIGLSKKDQDAFVQTFLASAQGKEGYLFPDTYLFPKTVSAEAVVTKMLSTFEKRTELKVNDIGNKDSLIIASIVERETLSSEERPIVAGILLKRFKAGWPLQADATLQYAVATTRCQNDYFECKWWETVGAADLEINLPTILIKRRVFHPPRSAIPVLPRLKPLTPPRPATSGFTYTIAMVKFTMPQQLKNITPTSENTLNSSNYPLTHF